MFVRMMAIHGYSVILARVVLGFSLVAAGVGKLVSSEKAVQFMADFLPFSSASLHPLAVSISLFEILAGIFVLLKLLNQPVLFLVAVLILMFILIQIPLVLNEAEADCGCFGAFEQANFSGWAAVACQSFGRMDRQRRR